MQISLEFFEMYICCSVIRVGSFIPFKIYFCWKGIFGTNDANLADIESKLSYPSLISRYKSIDSIVYLTELPIVSF